MDVFCCTYVSGRIKLKGPVAYNWIALGRLAEYPLPKANHKFLAQLRQYYEFGIRKAQGARGKADKAQSSKLAGKEDEKMRK